MRSDRYASGVSSILALILLATVALVPQSHAQSSDKLVLDGDFDTAQAADSPSLSVQGQIFTMEVWIKHDGTSDPDAMIIDKTEGNKGYELNLVGSGEEVPVRFNYGNFGDAVVSTSGIPADRWTHVAAVYDGTNLSLYLNGELDNQVSAGGGISDGVTPLVIGSTESVNERFFSGQIDELRIWDAARSALQIRDNRFGPLSGTETGLAAYYPFDNGALTDASGNGNTLTLQGDAALQDRDVFPVPPDVYVQEEGNGEVTLTWEERLQSGGNETSGAKVYRSGPSGTTTRAQLAATGDGTTLYTDASGLQNGSTYFYEVAVTTSDDESDFSPLISGTPHNGQEADPLKGGGALALDGDLDYAQATDRPSLSVTGTTITVEAWVKHDGTSDPDAMILDKTENNLGYELNLVGSGEEVPVRFNYGNFGDAVVSTSGIPADRWTHVAAVYDGTNLTLYLNGELDNQVSADGQISDGATDLYFGTTDAANDRFFSGRIDGVRIWSDARTQSEIQNTYTGTLTGTEADLEAVWRFNDAGKSVRTGETRGSGFGKATAQLQGDAAVNGPGALPVPPRLWGRSGDGQSTFTWAPGPSNPVEYSTYTSTGPDGSGRTMRATLTGTSRVYGSPNGQPVFYEVTGFNSEGQESDYAHPASVTPWARSFGNALTLDGSNDYGTVGDRPSLSFPTSDDALTVEAWVKHDGTSSPDALILDKTETNKGFDLFLDGSGSPVPVRFRFGTFGAGITSNTAIPANDWTHVAVTYNQNTLSLYINGVLDAQKSASGSVNDGNTPLVFGANDAGNDRFFSGQIDDVRVWGSVRSATEILQNYRTELIGNESDLLAYWRFNEPAGTAVSRSAAARPQTVAFSGDAATAPSAVQAVSALSAQSVSGDGAVDFGTTGVDVDFADTQNSATVVAEKFSTAPDAPSGISEQNVSTYRYVLRVDGDLTFGSNTEVRFDVSTLAGVTAPDEVEVYSRDTPGSGDFTARNATYNSSTNELVVTTDRFSEFVLASDTNPLPVEMTAFDVTQRGPETALLSWATASEQGNAGFRVEHRAPDASGWTEVGFVDGQGTTQRPSRYEHRVDDLAAGAHRFRLVQVDVDGTVHPGPTKRLTLELQQQAKLTAPAPNPVRQQAELTMVVKEASDVTVTLYNVLGQEVKTLHQGRVSANDRQRLRLRTDDLASGVYFVRMRAEGVVKTRRVTVVR